MKIFLMILGLLCVALGFVGIFLPLLPTTPFLLLAAWFFYQSSETLHNWLLNNKILGPFVKTYQSQRAIPLKGKVAGLLLLWTSMLISVVFVVHPLFVKAVLISIAILISLLILSIRTLKQ